MAEGERDINGASGLCCFQQSKAWKLNFPPCVSHRQLGLQLRACRACVGVAVLLVGPLPVSGAGKLQALKNTLYSESERSEQLREASFFPMASPTTPTRGRAASLGWEFEQHLLPGGRLEWDMVGLRRLLPT